MAETAAGRAKIQVRKIISTPPSAPNQAPSRIKIFMSDPPISFFPNKSSQINTAKIRSRNTAAAPAAAFLASARKASALTVLAQHSTAPAVSAPPGTLFSLESFIDIYKRIPSRAAENSISADRPYLFITERITAAKMPPYIMKLCKSNL